ncbi:MAG: DEAD/DEAH box helicase family protein [Myxococcales bacterium]|nr:DEAD/DEAH box helicase family protein [Myxococcales bacterium]
MIVDFDRGTLLLTRSPDSRSAVPPALLPGVLWDDRTGHFRAPGRFHRAVCAYLARAKVSWGYGTGWPASPPLEPIVLHRGVRESLTLRDHQRAALAAWLPEQWGVIALPTGSGKTRVALAAIAALAVTTLILVPTRVLLHQWVAELERWFQGRIGRLGDGVCQLASVTVATFASFVRALGGAGRGGAPIADQLTAGYDLLVIDEAHHATEAALRDALDLSTARRRLGLTATPPEDPAALADLSARVGPTVFQVAPVALAGDALAPFHVVVVPVSLSADAAVGYGRDLATIDAAWQAFRLDRPSELGHAGTTWRDFVKTCHRTPWGRDVVQAIRRNELRLAYPEAKRAALSTLLKRHFADRCLVFAPDNGTVYRIARDHLIAPITCDIGAAERQAVLRAFELGELRHLVSGRVLNEGMDVPAAGVAIIVGGRGGAREHVQRVGRVLRPAPGKRAIVYELVVQGTQEVMQSGRRNRSLVGAGN